MVRYSKNLEDKTYIVGKNKAIYASTFNSNYEKMMNDYINRKIKYMDIVDKLDQVIKDIKIYEKNKESYTNPNIEDHINNSKKCAKGLEKNIAEIDNIGRDFIAESGPIDLSWMNDPRLYEEISQDVFARYKKGKDSFELFTIQTFLDNINDEYIKNNCQRFRVYNVWT